MGPRLSRGAGGEGEVDVEDVELGCANLEGVPSMGSKRSEATARWHADLLAAVPGQQVADVALRCPICWDTMADVRATRCGHVFCAGCIKYALHHKKECPSCRAPVGSQRELLDAEVSGALLLKQRVQSDFQAGRFSSRAIFKQSDFQAARAERAERFAERFA